MSGIFQTRSQPRPFARVSQSSKRRRGGFDTATANGNGPLSPALSPSEGEREMVAESRNARGRATSLWRRVDGGGAIEPLRGRVGRPIRPETGNVGDSVR